MRIPTPHLEKLRAALENEKLPKEDAVIIEAAIQRYEKWIESLQSVTGENPSQIVTNMVGLLNEYRLYLDVDVIFDREADFLYRQKGQMKLDNSVLEEFLPHLIYKCVIERGSYRECHYRPDDDIFIDLFCIKPASSGSRWRAYCAVQRPRFRNRPPAVYSCLL